MNNGVIVWTNPHGSVGATTLAAAAQEGRFSTLYKAGGGWLFEPTRVLAKGLYEGGMCPKVTSACR